MERSSKKEKEYDYDSFSMHSIVCPKCDGEGVVVKNRKECTCKECDGEGILYREA